MYIQILLKLSCKKYYWITIYVANLEEKQLKVAPGAKLGHNFMAIQPKTCFFNCSDENILNYYIIQFKPLNKLDKWQLKVLFNYRKNMSLFFVCVGGVLKVWQLCILKATAINRFTCWPGVWPLKSCCPVFFSATAFLCKTTAPLFPSNLGLKRQIIFQAF